MNKHQSLFMTLVVIFCVILAGGGCFYLGTKMNNDTSENECQKQKNEDNEKVNKTKEDIKEFAIPEVDENLSIVLYNYLNSNSKNYEEYLTKDMPNSHKLYLGGVYQEKTLKEIKQNLINYFGSDLNVAGEDYYFDDTLLYKYNSSTDKFSRVAEFGHDSIDLGAISVYNYKLGSFKQTSDEVVLTYYGLYLDTSSMGNYLLTNNKNINRYTHDYEEDGIQDEDYLNGKFTENKNDFFKFVYTYKLVDGKYVLVDFKKI